MSEITRFETKITLEILSIHISITFIHSHHKVLTTEI